MLVMMVVVVRLSSALSDDVASLFRCNSLSHRSDGKEFLMTGRQEKGCFTPPLDVVARWLAHRSFYPNEDDVIDVHA